jgi:hypothetical protein
MKTDKTESSLAGAYPYFPLTLAIKISDAVQELGGGRSEVQKSVLASHLSETEKSATFLQRITTAKCFGLIEGRGAYTLSELAKRYYFPTSDGDKPAALLEILATPLAFKSLISRFDGSKLPTREILANILHRECGVANSWKERVASMFLNSVQFVGAVDSNGFLRYGAAKHGAPQAPLDPPSIAVVGGVPTPKKQQSSGPAGPTDEMCVWSYTLKGKSVRLETPVELSQALWDKLSAYVQQVIKPSKEDDTQ